MQKIALQFGFAMAGLLLTTSTGMADSFNYTSGTHTSAQTLTDGQNGSVSSGATLNVNGTSSSSVAVTVTGTTSITNGGTIEQTGTRRAIASGSSTATLTVTNNANATISAAAEDAIHMSNAGDTVTIYNSGTISNANAGGSQALDFNNITTGGNTVNNYSTGIISSANGDAIRTGVNGVVNNSGKIQGESEGSDGGGNDGIDAQTNTGAVITNGSASPNTNLNLIEGAAHGISGGADTDKHDSGYDQPFVMTITNYAGATIQGDDGSGINLDGVDNTEQITITNHGTIQGDGVTGDGDGVDVDGVVNLNNTGTIQSLNALNDTSEGVTVGGGTIINSGTIEGSGTIGRGITLAGIDHTTNNKVDTSIAIQKIYANPFSSDGLSTNNPSGTSYITNDGTIRGDSDAGIAIAGSATTGTSYAVVITNNADGTIRGNSSTVAVIDGSATVGGSVSPIASTNNETVINYGIIQQDGTGKAISLGSGSNSVQILGGAASINGDISGGTSAGSNTLLIDPNLVTTNSPTTGQSFSYSHSLSNFNSVSLSSGTITLSGANTYTGNTAVTGGTTYINNTSGSGTGTGDVAVSANAKLGGFGIIQPGSGNGVSLSTNSTLISGGDQVAASPTTLAGKGLTLDNTKTSATTPNTILDASAGNVNLTFYLGAEAAPGGSYSVSNPDQNSSYLTVLDNGGVEAAGELKFALTTDTVTLSDLTNGHLQLSINSPYLLIKAGSDADYVGLTTTGDVNGLTNQDGYVTNVSLNSDFTAEYASATLYLSNGELEVVPEPSAWAMALSGIAVLIFIQARRRKL